MNDGSAVKTEHHQSEPTENVEESDGAFKREPSTSISGLKLNDNGAKLKEAENCHSTTNEITNSDVTRVVEPTANLSKPITNDFDDCTEKVSNSLEAVAHSEQGTQNIISPEITLLKSDD